MVWKDMRSIHETRYAGLGEAAESLVKYAQCMSLKYTGKVVRSQSWRRTVANMV